MSDIDRNSKLSSEDVKKFLTIQFKHWQKDMTQFQQGIVNKFEQVFPEEVDFDKFLNVISEI